MTKRKRPSDRILERIKHIGILEYVENSAKKIPTSGDFEHLSRLDDSIKKAEKIKKACDAEEKANGEEV